MPPRSMTSTSRKPPNKIPGSRLPIFFFFTQKTAYEILRSDWSSDVCSSDLCCGVPSSHSSRGAISPARGCTSAAEIGRASCRKECVSTCRSRWSPYHEKKKKKRKKSSMEKQKAKEVEDVTKKNK